MSWANIVKYVNLGLDVANTGANIYGNVKNAEATAKSKLQQGNTTTTVVQQKSKEEIALEREMFIEKKKKQKEQDDFVRAFLLNKSAEDKPLQKKDNSTLWIAGGIALLIITITIVKDVNNKKE